MSREPNLSEQQLTGAQAALAEAVKNAGGPTELAMKLGISHQAIGQWTVCPPLRVLAVSQLGYVPPWKLRPDLYPAPAEAAA
jgi:DNA-binding transcriptional regulator YdaS (Cro superfamily)